MEIITEFQVTKMKESFIASFQEVWQLEKNADGEVIEAVSLGIFCMDVEEEAPEDKRFTPMPSSLQKEFADAGVSTMRMVREWKDYSYSIHDVGTDHADIFCEMKTLEMK